MVSTDTDKAWWNFAIVLALMMLCFASVHFFMTRTKEMSDKTYFDMVEELEEYSEDIYNRCDSIADMEKEVKKRFSKIARQRGYSKRDLVRKAKELQEKYGGNRW